MSLEVLNFASLNSDVTFDALERLVSRCKALRVLKVNKHISLEQIQKLLLRVPQLMEVGTGSFQQELVPRQFAELETAFGSCKNLHILSGLWEASSVYLPVIYPACANLTYLNLSYATLQSDELSKLLPNCSNLRRLWVRNFCSFTFPCHNVSSICLLFWLVNIKYRQKRRMVSMVQ